MQDYRAPSRALSDEKRLAAGGGAGSLQRISTPRIFRYFKTSPEIIRLAVMMDVRYPLSLRTVEDLLHERGIDITRETVRFWWNRLGTIFSAEIRRRRVAALRHFRRRDGRYSAFGEYEVCGQSPPCTD